ncbi:MAG: hypothetical protein HUK15_04720 [Bacteroidales bacterium]|nr:hypothetical protein [Bacteroidales bacterium]
MENNVISREEVVIQIANDLIDMELNGVADESLPKWRFVQYKVMQELASRDVSNAEFDFADYCCRACGGNNASLSVVTTQNELIAFEVYCRDYIKKPIVRFRMNGQNAEIYKSAEYDVKLSSADMQMFVCSVLENIDAWLSAEYQDFRLEAMKVVKERNIIRLSIRKLLEDALQKLEPRTKYILTHEQEFSLIRIELTADKCLNIKINNNDFFEDLHKLADVVAKAREFSLCFPNAIIEYSDK